MGQKVGVMKRSALAVAIAASMVHANAFMGFKGGGLHQGNLSINRVLGSGGLGSYGPCGVGSSARPWPKPFGGAKQWKARKRQNHGNGKGRSN